MSRWQRSREMTAKTWGLIRANPQLLKFAVRSAVVGALVAAAFLIPAAIVLAAVENAGGVVVAALLAFGGMWLAAYLSMRYIAGLVWVADKLLKDQPATYEQGMAAAAERSRQLAIWSLISVAVGWILNAVQGLGDDHPVMAVLRLVLASLLAAAWSLITFFMLPLIVLEDLAVGAALKRSVHIIRQKWGEAVVGSFRIGVRVGLMFILPGIVAVIAGFAIATGAGGAAGVLAGALLCVGGAVLIVVGAVRQMAARQVFGVALYHYATAGEIVGPFVVEELESAVTRKRSRTRG